MGKEIVYCSVCGERVPAADFDKGMAVTVQNRHFCRNCVPTPTAEASEGDSHDPTATAKQLRFRTQRMPLTQKPGLENFRTPFLIAGVILLATTIVLLVVLFGRSG